MSIRAGSIVTVAGRNVVDRLQSAGLGDARVPVETIREIGNDIVVDKVPGEPDFTFSMESWDVSTDLLAFLQGAIGDQAANLPPGNTHPAGTDYRWENCQFVNITSPWKSNTGSQGGDVGGGLLIPGYYPTRLRYRFGVTDNAVQEVELAGGSFYYARTTPVEEIGVGDGLDTIFVTTEDARPLRLGGVAGTTYQYVFGVLVNGVLQVRGVDYTETVAVPGDPGVATVTFLVAPPVGAQIKLCYFTEEPKALPQAVNADATIKPGAVRGRNIVILVGRSGDELQQLSVTGTGGTFDIDWGAETAAAVPYNATNAQMVAALEGMPGIGVGDVRVAGPFVSGNTRIWRIRFVGALANANQVQLTVDHTNVLGGAASASTTVEAGGGGNQVRLSGVQTVELEATMDGEVEREMGNEEITGRVINGTDVTGTVTIRPKDIAAFFNVMSRITGGISQDEVFSYFNLAFEPVEIQIQNPKNPGEILKTLYLEQGQFQPPGTPARVNQATDFGFQFNAVNGTFSEFKGRRP